MDSMADGQGRRLGDGGRFTKESPFEFEGVRVWSDDYWPETGTGTFYAVTTNAMSGATPLPLSRRRLRALSACFEAWSPDGWAWINDDHTEARKGRFTVELRAGVWIGHHDDFPDVWWDAKSAGGKTTNAHQVRNMLREFNVWRETSTPKPAKFVPLDVPEVGQWIEATLAGGSVKTFKVTGIEEKPTSWYVLGSVGIPHIDKDAIACGSEERIDSWRPIDPPAPAEPTKWGLVGHVTDPGGRVSSIYRRINTPGERYASVSHTNGLATYCPDWRGVLALGTFTAVTK